MSQKYPEGAIVVREDAGEKRKILGCAGEVRFLSINEDFTTADSRLSYTESELERYGWKVLEEPWVPKEGGRCAFIDAYGIVQETYYQVNEYPIRKLSEAKNLYEPGSQALKDAQARVLKAYRG